MTDADRQWIQERLVAFAAMIGAGTAEADSKVVKVLREEIGQLRASISLLEAHKAPADVALEGVVPMRKGRHAA